MLPKKILSLLLTGVLIFGSAIPSYADSQVSETSRTEIVQEENVPEEDSEEAANISNDLDAVTTDGTDDQPQIFLAENASVLTEATKFFGVNYYNIIQFEVAGDWIGNSGEINYNLHGEYTSVSFKAGYMSGDQNDKATMSVYADGELLGETVLTYESAKTFTYNVSGVSHFRIVLKCTTSYTKCYGIAGMKFQQRTGSLSSHSYDSDEFLFQYYDKDRSDNLTPKEDTFSMGGNEYTTGFTMTMYNWVGHTAKVGFNCQEHMKEISFDIGFVEGVMGTPLTFTVTGDGENLLDEDSKTIVVSDIPHRYTINVEGVSSLIITVKNSSSVTNGQTIGIGNVQFVSDGTPMGIVMSADQTTLDSSNGKAQITAKVYPSDAADKSVTFSPSDSTILALGDPDQNRIDAYALSKGKEKVTATTSNGLFEELSIQSNVDKISPSISLHKTEQYEISTTPETRKVQLKWTAPSSAVTSYTVQIATDTIFNNIVSTEDVNSEEADTEENTEDITYVSDVLGKNRTYYFKVIPHIAVTGGTTVDLPESKVLSIKTGNFYSAKDCWGLENAEYNLGYLDFYKVFSGHPLQALSLSNKFGGDSYVCFGQALSAATSVVYGVPTTGSWNDSLFDIKEADRQYVNPELGITAEKYIDCAMIYQYTDEAQKEKADNQGQISALVAAVKDGTKPVIITMKGHHAVWGMRVLEDIDTQTVIEIYDSNYAFIDSEESYQFPELVLKKGDNGAYTSFEYTVRFPGCPRVTFEGDESGDYSGSTDEISYMSDISKNFSRWITKKTTASQSNRNLLRLNFTNKSGSTYADQLKRQYNSIDSLQASGSASSSSGTELYYVDGDEISLDNVPAGVEVSLISAQHEVTAKASRAAKIQLDVTDSKDNSTEITLSANGTYNVGFYDTNEEGTYSTKTEVNGDAAKDAVVKVAQSDDDVQISGADTIAYETWSGTDDEGTVAKDEEGNIPETDTKSSETYQVTHDEKTINFKSGTDFSTVVLQKNMGAADDSAKEEEKTTSDTGTNVSKVSTGSAYNLAEGKITLKSAVTYTGKAQQPKVTVKFGTETLQEGKDYKVTYSNNKSIGTARITITGIGSSYGEQTKTFTINPKGTKLASLKGASKGMTVKWKKHSAQTTGYQIRYSLSSKMKKAKTVTVKGAKKTSVKVKKLKAKKTYYVQIRTYKTVKGKNYCSSWSGKKKVKTK